MSARIAERSGKASLYHRFSVAKVAANLSLRLFSQLYRRVSRLTVNVSGTKSANSLKRRVMWVERPKNG